MPIFWIDLKGWNKIVYYLIYHALQLVWHQEHLVIPKKFLILISFINLGHVISLPKFLDRLGLFSMWARLSLTWTYLDVKTSNLQHHAFVVKKIIVFLMMFQCWEGLTWSFYSDWAWFLSVTWVVLRILVSKFFELYQISRRCFQIF